MPQDTAPCLVVLGGPLSGTRLDLDDAVDNILIGSDPSCGLALDHPSVSPIHARLWIDLEGAIVYDTRSTHGVYVNDDRVEGEHPLRSGDILWLGSPGDEGSVMIQCRLPARPAPGSAAARMAAAPAAEALDSSARSAPPAAAAAVDADDPPAVPDEDVLEIADDVPAAAPRPDAAASFAADLGDDVLIPADEGAADPPASPFTSALADAKQDEAATFAELDDIEALEVPTDATVQLPPMEPDDRTALTELTELMPVIEDDGPELEPELDPEPAPTVMLSAAALRTAVAAPDPEPLQDAFDDFPTLLEQPAADVADAPELEATVLDMLVPDLPIAAAAPGELESTVSDQPAIAAAAAAARPTPAVPTPRVAPPAARVAPVAAPAASPAPGPPPLARPAPPVAVAPPPMAAPRGATPAARAAAVPVPARSAGAAAPSRSPTPAAPPPRATREPAQRAPAAPAPRAAVPVAEPSPSAEPPPARPTRSTAPLMAGAGVAAALIAVAAYFLMPKQGAPPVPPAATTAPTAPTLAAAPPAAAVPDPAAGAAPAVPEAPLPIEEEVTIVATPASPGVPVAGPSTRPPVSMAAAAPAAAARPAVTQPASVVPALLAQAEAAMTSASYDPAILAAEQILKLEPTNSRAQQIRSQGTAARDALKRTFVAGTTQVKGTKEAKGGLAGFDTGGVSVQKSPDFSGRLDLSMTPARVKPGDPYTLRVHLANDGKKAIKISGLQVATIVNGTRSGGAAAPRAKEVGPQQRVLIEERSGVWDAAATSWSAEVVMTANKGDSLRNQITWK